VGEDALNKTGKFLKIFDGRIQNFPRCFCSIIPHLELLSDTSLPEEDIKIVMGNENEEKVTTIGPVNGNVINKNGKILGFIILKNGQFNLKSITKVMNS
jgi:hypothetical protein